MANIFDGSSTTGQFGDGTIDFTPSPPPKSSSGSNNSSSNSSKYDNEMDQYIAYLSDALKSSSGFRREQLQAQLDQANADRAARTQAAQIAADASKYSADRSLEGTRYASDNSLTGTKYSSDASAGASRYGSDQSLAGTKYASDNSRTASQYSADKSFEGTKYGVDADLYKFGQTQPLEQADRAQKLLDAYFAASQNPANVFQAAELARNGQLINGMPTFISQLLGQTASPYASGASHPIAALPGSQATAMFGQNGPFAGNGQGLYGAPAVPAVAGVAPGTAVSYAPGQGVVRPASVAALRAGTAGSAQPYSTQVAAGLAPALTTQGGGQVYTADQASQAYANQQAAQAAAAANGPRSTLQQGMLISNGDYNNDQAYLAALQQAIQRGPQTFANGSLERQGELESGALDSALKASGLSVKDFRDNYARTRIGGDGDNAGTSLAAA